MDFNNITKASIDKMTKAEKMELLTQAKDAYYNTGTELISDALYDYVEKSLGLENKSYIGSEAGNYDVKHAFIMGSLSKTQVKEQKNGTVNWDECVDKLNSFLSKSRNATYYETSPKLDGCSFSAEFKNVNGHASLETVATRGNGKYGTDIKHWFKPMLKTDYWSKINDAVINLCDEDSDDILCIRGEVLVKQSDFVNKYVNTYTNPRAFTAGMLGIKFEDATQDKLTQGGDLHFVCYDYRLVKDDEYVEMSWMNPNDRTYRMISPYLNHIGELPEKTMCQCYSFSNKITVDDLKDIYDDYDNFRKNNSEYALDGIVFKPNCTARQYNEERERPVDCIALKFMPMINATKINNIEWDVKKTGEYFPTAIVDPVIMPDGKKITRASLFNYGWIVNNKCGIGSEVRISLAGDIIPFVYEIVTHEDPTNNMNMPTDTRVVSDPKSGALHLMKNFTADEEQKNKFKNSCLVLNINTIGPAAADQLYDTLNDEIDDLTNIIYLMNDDAYDLIYEKLGDSKSIQNIVNNLKQYAQHITLVDIIKSFCFKACGVKASEVCAKLMSGLPVSTASLPAEAYQWANQPNSRQYYLVKQAMDDLGVDFLEDDVEENADRIPIIMTGSPDACGYATKGKFLQAHPEYVETTSWKEVKILFTDDINSNSGKMQKARKACIEIKRYDEADNNSNSSVSNTTQFDFNKATNKKHAEPEQLSLF